MSPFAHGRSSSLARLRDDYLPERFGHRGRSELSPNLLTAGVVALGVVALAWYVLGPDVKRYMKIRNM